MADDPRPIETAKRVGRPPITLPDRLTIRTLHDRGYSDAQIARALAITPSQCREALADARAVLEANALALVTDALTASDIAARKGDHRPARDLLDRLGVTDATKGTQQTTNVGVQVHVSGFTFPGLPVPQPQALEGAPAPAIDVVATPARTEESE